MTRAKTRAAQSQGAAGNGSVSTTDGLTNMVAGLGTSRDKMSYSSWEAPRTLTYVELDNMYRSSWLAKRIVNSVADDMTRAWRDANSDDDTHELLEQVEKRFNVQAKVNEALRWARLYGGSVIVIGTKDADFAAPLDLDTIKQGGLNFLEVLDRWRITASGTLNMDFGKPNFGEPDSYALANTATTVHASRVIRFNGQRLPWLARQQNAGWHDSELLHVYDSITNISTANQAVATMLFEANVDVISGVKFADLLSTKNGEDRMRQRFSTAALMKSFNRVLLLDDSEKYDKKSNTFTGLTDIMRQFAVDVCGAADIPMTRLFGESAKGMNSTGEGDLRNYYDMVSARQESDMRPQLEYLDQILFRHATGKPPSESYEWRFNNLWQTSDKDRAAIEKTRAERDAIYLKSGVLKAGVVAQELLQAGTYRALTTADVAGTGPGIPAKTGVEADNASTTA